MDIETTKPQAAPIKWVEDGVNFRSACGVYYVEHNIDQMGRDYYACFGRGRFLGPCNELEQACDLCQRDRQREFEIIGGYRHEGDSLLWI